MFVRWEEGQMRTRAPYILAWAKSGSKGLPGLLGYFVVQLPASVFRQAVLKRDAGSDSLVTVGVLGISTDAKFAGSIAAMMHDHCWDIGQS